MSASNAGDRIVVIGGGLGGLGGLAAACTLAARGYRVELIERNRWVGGKAAVLEGEGFRFDMGPTILTLPSVLKRIFAEADRSVDRELDLIPLDPQWRCFFDGSVLDLEADAERMSPALESFSPRRETGESYRRFLELSEKLHEISDRYFFWRPVGSMGDMFDPKASFRLSVLSDLGGRPLSRSKATRRPGAARGARGWPWRLVRLGRCWALPVAVEYVFGEERLPEIWVRFFALFCRFFPLVISVRAPLGATSALVPGQVFPRLEGQSLDDRRTVALPELAGEEPFLVFFALTRDAGDELRSWIERLRKEYPPRRLEAFHVPALAQIPSLFRGFARAALRRTVPESRHESVLLLLDEDEEKRWKSRVRFDDEWAVYIVAVDSEGRVAKILSSRFSERAYRRLDSWFPGIAGPAWGDP